MKSKIALFAMPLVIAVFGLVPSLGQASNAENASCCSEQAACCTPGAACCEPGAKQKAKQEQETKTSAQNCCAPGASCCTPGAVCCQ
jgi:hypothetical protein